MTTPLGSKSTGGVVQPPSQSSASQNTSVGSGSKPGSGSIKIETSTDGCDPHTLGRAPGGWLK